MDLQPCNNFNASNGIAWNSIARISMQAIYHHVILVHHQRKPYPLARKEVILVLSNTKKIKGRVVFVPFPGRERYVVVVLEIAGFFKIDVLRILCFNTLLKQF